MEESIVLSELILNKTYTKKVLPYLKADYFEEIGNKVLFKVIKNFIGKYRKLPSLSAVAVEVGKLSNLTENRYNEIMETLNDFQSYKPEESIDWLVDNTEEFCLRRAAANALFKSSEIVNEATDIKKLYQIKDLIDQALMVNFNRDVGIEYWSKKSISERWQHYTKKKVKYKTNIEKLNYVTGGGGEPKKLHVLFGDTHVGKTMSLTSLTAGFIKNGYDTLYVTLEMSREDIAKLIDANFTDIKINDIAIDQTEDQYTSKLERQNTNDVGRLFIYEFPTGNASTNNIRALLEDLKHKKGFEPQVIVVDYINLMRCDRYHDGNSYTLVKGIAEELRGLAVEGFYSIWSATQTNRGASNASDIQFADTAESYGLPQTVDLLIGLISTDTLKEENIIIMKILKNRIFGITNYKFPVTTMFEYARLVNCDKDHDAFVQNNEQSKSVMDKTINKDKIEKLKVNIDKQSTFDLFDE